MAEAVAVILAAGDGARLKSELAKPLHRVCGRALIEYAVEAARGAGLAGIAVVAPPENDALAQLLGPEVPCVPGGDDLAASIDAALAALPASDTVLILPCDVPQLEAGHLRALLTRHAESGAASSALSVGGVSTGAYAVNLPAAALQSEIRNPKSEIRLEGEPLVDVNTRADMARAGKLLRRAIAERLMDEGVTLIDPDNTYIDAGVRVGMDTIIHPWSVIEGDVEIGRRCTIGPHAHLIGCTVEDDVAIEAAVVRHSRLRRGVRVGPYAQIRPGCDVGEGTKVGDFVELKNARIGERVSIAHLAYVGDAVVGSGVNIGCGVITCNYDGVRKNQTTIGDNAFIGSNSVLIAPVTIGEGAYIAANSAINQDVPDGALGIARPRQENKEGWAARRRRQQGKE